MLHIRTIPFRFTIKETLQKASPYIEELFFQRNEAIYLHVKAHKLRLATKFSHSHAPVLVLTTVVQTGEMTAGHDTCVLTAHLFLREKYFTASTRSRFKSPSAEKQAA